MKKKSIAIVATVLVSLLLCLLQSCKTMDNLHEVINVRDSTIYHHVYDTTRITVYDTTRVEIKTSVNTESGTNIQFGDGGGTYNAQTGEATNVQSVQQSQSSQEDSHIVAEYSHKMDSIASHVDSLKHLVTAYSSELEHEKMRDSRSGWDKFCTKWFIGSALVLLVLLLWWLADYIPALKGIKTIVKTFIKL